jgi:hypothetical protein
MSRFVRSGISAVAMIETIFLSRIIPGISYHMISRSARIGNTLAAVQSKSIPVFSLEPLTIAPPNAKV